MRASVRLLSRSVYGRYQVLDPASHIKVYPDVRPVPEEIPRPAHVPVDFFTADWGEHTTPFPTQEEGRLDEEGIRGVRRAGKMAAQILKETKELIQPGVTTDEIDFILHDYIVSLGAYPAPLGMKSFPRSITTSVNNVIAHGVPDDRELDERDIINIDLTVFYKGYHGDTSATFMLPKVDQQGRDLVGTTKQALEEAIKICGPGVPFSRIGEVIQKGYSVNEQFCGHGIGKHFHGLPYILHHLNMEPGEMQPGDCFTIEPCLVQGENSRGQMWDDGWTLSTESGARSAQFEHQIVITPNGAEVVTR